MLDHEWFRVAQVSEDVIVEEEAALIHAFFLLPLAAHAQNGPELLQLYHYAVTFVLLS